MPDVAIAEDNPETGKYELKWAVEVSLTKTYAALKDDMELLLKGYSHVRQCALVKITETHDYAPPPPMTDEEIAEHGLKDALTIQDDDFSGEGYGPIRYGNKVWAGIKEIFWETWELDPATDEPVQVGERQFIYPISSESQPQPEISLNQILSIRAETLVPPWDIFRDHLQPRLKGWARFRYIRWYWETRGEYADKSWGNEEGPVTKKRKLESNE